MKKITALAILAISLVACKKEVKKTIVDPKTGKTTTVTVTEEEVKKPEVIPAVKDSAGVYTLHYKLEKGKTYPFVTVQKDTKSATMGPQSQSGSTESIDDMSFVVNNFDKGVYDIDIVLNSKKTTSTGQGKTVVIDTKAAEPKEANLKIFYKVNKALMGNKLQMKMDDNGKILSIGGFEPIYTKVNAAVSGLVKNQQEKAQFAQGFKNDFNEKMLKEQFKKSFELLPAKGVKLGGSWNESQNLTPDGKLKNTTTFTLSKVENGIAYVNIKGGIPRKSEQKSQNGVTQSMSFEGTENGTFKIDANTGWLMDSVLNSTSSQTQSLSDGKQSQTMVQKTSSVLKINPGK